MNIEITAGPLRSHIVQHAWLPPDQQAALREELSATVPGAHYVTAALAAKQMEGESDSDSTEGWDGVYRLLTKAGRFPAGLTDRVTRWLQDKGHWVTVTNQLPHYTPDSPPVAWSGTLDPEQEEAVQALLATKRGMVSAPPRSGKTLIAAEAIRRAGVFPAVFLLERLDIAQPPRGAVTKFQDYFGDTLKIGWAYDGQVEVGDIMVVTVQTACQAIQQKLELTDDDIPEDELDQTGKAVLLDVLHKARLVYTDEGHHLAAPTYRAVLREMKQREYCWSGSGTPYRDDNLDLLMEGACGPIVHTITRQQMIRRNRLVPAHIYLAQMPHKEYKRGAAFPTRRADYIHRNPIRNKAIVEFVQMMVSKQLSVMVICDHTVQVRIIHNHLKTARIDHVCMAASGKYATEPRDRQDVWDDLQEKKNLVVVTTLGQEGLDVPSMAGVVIAAGGASSVRAMQRFRCMTAWPGKDACYVLDFVDDAKYFEAHSKDRLRMYMTEPPGVFYIHHVTQYMEVSGSVERWLHSHRVWDDIVKEAKEKGQPS